MDEVRVLLISDGRPGHTRLGEGVVAAVRRQRRVRLDRIEVRNRWAVPKAAIPKLCRRLPPAACLKYVYGIDASAIARPDLIVSAGGMTLGANVSLAALLKTPNVFCGTTRGFPIPSFSLVLTDDPAEGGPANVRVCPKPSAFDPDGLPAPRPIEAVDTPVRIGVLIGGPVPSAAFDRADWARLARLVDDLAGTSGHEVVVVTGPRTPETAYAALAPTVTRNPERVSLVDFRTAGPGSSAAALGADLVLVTSDSMSAMTEAALSQRPAIALRPSRTAPSRDDAAIDWLVGQGWLALCDLAAITTETVFATASQLTPMTANHLDGLARIVVPLLGDNVPGPQP